jgi:hypothetical protein
MDYEVPDLERCSRLGCSDDFDKRLFAEIRITGTYINVVSKWRVEGIGFHAEFIDPAGGPSHRIRIMIVQMRGERTNLNDVEAAPTDRFQTIKDTMLAKTTGG